MILTIIIAKDIIYFSSERLLYLKEMQKDQGESTKCLKRGGLQVY